MAHRRAEKLLLGSGIPVEIDDLDEYQVRRAESDVAELIESIRRREINLAPEVERIVVQLLYGYRVRLDKKLLELSQLRQMAEIKDAVDENVADPEVRQQLSDLVSEFAKQQQELSAKLHERETAEARELRRIEVQERKWRMRKSLLDREPAAVLIGGLLLLILTSALIIGMFTSAEIPDILANGFLLILGFFFGQTTHRTGPADPSD